MIMETARLYGVSTDKQTIDEAQRLFMEHLNNTEARPITVKDGVVIKGWKYVVAAQTLGYQKIRVNSISATHTPELGAM